MTTCSSSFRALCLGLALLATKASADRKPPALASLESLPMFSGAHGHHGPRNGDNEYDRGQEYMLAMPQGTLPSPPTGNFGTDSYTDTTEGEDADRGSWKHLPGSSATTSGRDGVLVFDGNHRSNVREYLRHGLPVVSKAYEIEQSPELGHRYNVDSDATFAKYFEQQKPIVSQTYEVDSDSVLRKYFEHTKPIVSETYKVDSDAIFSKYLEQQKPKVSQTYEVDSDAVFSKYLEQQKPIVSQIYDVDSDSGLRKYFDQQKPIVSQTYDLGSDSVLRKYFEQRNPIFSETYNMDSDAVFSKYLQQRKPIVSQTYDVDSSSVLGKYFEQQKPVVSQTYEVDSDSVLREYFEQQKPVVSQTFDVDSSSVLGKYFEQQEPIVTKTTEVLSNPIVRNSYSIKPVYSVLPGMRKSVSVLPPPIVKRLYKVMPAPVINKYFTAPPVVQSVKASPPVFNKFVKNIFVQRPEQRQQPFVVVPAPSKNVYNLIKLVAPTPKPVEVPTTPAPTTPVPTTPAPTTPAPTTAAPTTAAPTTTPLPLAAESLVAEADEEATEEQKLKSIGKMVVVETVRRVVDVPEFDGPAPPPARSEETVVEPDGTVRKFEKYIEYDQVSGKQQAAAVRTSHSKKQSSKSSYAVKVSPVQVDAARTSTAASPATARLLHSSTFFPGTSGMEVSPGFFSRFGGGSFDSMTRTQFGKALSEPAIEEENPQYAPFTPAEDLSEQMMEMDSHTQNTGAELVAKPSEYLELPSETPAHDFTAEPASLPKEAATVAPFA